MARWTRIARGMFGTGFAFAVGTGIVTTAIGAIIWLINRDFPPIDLLRVAGRFSVVAFILGLAFSAGLALLARARIVSRLSLPTFAGLGAGAGFLYFLFIGFANGFAAWTPRVMVGNLILLLVMGTAAAVGTLLVARKAQSALGGDDEELGALGSGDDGGASAFADARSKVKVGEER